MMTNITAATHPMNPANPAALTYTTECGCPSPCESQEVPLPVAVGAILIVVLFGVFCMSLLANLK